jgi:D-alanine-D-alanine ligase
MALVRVGVLRGGTSHEYDVSLQTGTQVLRHLSTDKYDKHDLLIDKRGDWFMDGLPVDPTTLPQRLDVVFNALHGWYGEDGQVQNLFDRLHLPYTGSGHLASALGMNKIIQKDYYRAAGLKVPLAVVIEVGDDLSEATNFIFQKISPPWIVKPAAGGSSVGVSLIRQFVQLATALEEAFRYGDQVLVEEFIKGKEVSCGVVENFRNQELYPLMPVEIVPPETKDFYDYEAKYTHPETRIRGALISDEEKQTIMAAAQQAHQALGLKHYSRTDFIISPQRGVYMIEINSLPGLTEHSILPNSLEQIGCSLAQFLDHVIGLALASQ